MRITYLHYLSPDDTALHHVRQFADAVRDLGHDIRTYGLNLARPREGTHVRPRTRGFLRVRLSRYLRHPQELLSNGRYLSRQLSIVRNDRPDVILARAARLSVAEVLLAKITAVPLVVEVNAPASSDRYDTECVHVPGLTRSLEAMRLRGAAQITVVSNALAAHLISRYGVESRKFVVNHNGADCTLFHPCVDGSAIRERYALDGHPVVGFVGSLKPWHGEQVLRALIARLSAHGVRFLLVGDGGDWARMDEWITRSGMEGTARRVGGVPHSELPPYIAAMDVALMPDSNFWGSPLKVIEYMATGRATVAPRYGPLEELIEDGHDGLLFAPGDATAACEAITALLENHARRRAMGAAAAKKVMASLTWRHNAARAIEACERARRCSVRSMTSNGSQG